MSEDVSDFNIGSLVTPMRLESVLKELDGDVTMEQTVRAMTDNILGEIATSKEVKRSIGKHTARLFEQRLHACIR